MANSFKLRPAACMTSWTTRWRKPSRMAVARSVWVRNRRPSAGSPPSSSTTAPSSLTILSSVIAPIVADRQVQVSVLRNRRIDFVAPGIDAAQHVLDFLEASGPQNVAGFGAAAAHLAMRDDLDARIELVQPLRQIAQRDQLRARDAGDLVLVRLTHIDELELVAAIEARLESGHVNLGVGFKSGLRF